MQQTITIYMLPFALMTLVQGPLSDALGRRPVVLVGLLVYAVGVRRVRVRSELRMRCSCSARCRA